MRPWTEGVRCSWSWESSGLTRGWVGHGGGKEGFLAGTQRQAAGDLQCCSICPDFLDVEQSLRCVEGGQGLGRLNTNHTYKIWIAARNHCFSVAGYTGTCILLGLDVQEPSTFYMISVCSTQGYWCYFFRGKPWKAWLADVAAKALPHGLCLSEVKTMAGASGTSRVNTSNSAFSFGIGGCI